jgi:hypothetical protein
LLPSVPGSEVLVMLPSTLKQEREAQREAVKTLAIAVGVREAARRLNLNENTILSWARRDNWQIVTPKPNGPPRNQPAIKASDALRSSLEEDNHATKLSLSKGLRKAAKHVESSEGSTLFAKAKNVKELVGAASQLHQWEQVEQGGGVLPGLKVYSNQTVIQVSNARG